MADIVVILNGNTYSFQSDFTNGGHLVAFPAALRDFLADAGKAPYTTSATEAEIGDGTKAFTLATDRPFAVGAFVMIASAAAPSTKYMHAIVTAKSGASLTVSVDLAVGSGNATDWVISLSAPIGDVDIDVAAAIAAVTAAELARDAALVGADFYDDTATGLAAVSEGGFFRVMAGDSKSFSLYRDDSGVATLIGEFPAKGLVDDALAIVNGGLLEDAPTFAGIGDYTSTGTDGVGKAYFEAGETGLASVRWPLASNVLVDEKVTLVYRMTTVSAGIPYAQLRISGGSAMSSNVNFTNDGLVHHMVLTANQLYVNMNVVDGTEATIELVLIRGDMDADAATETGLVRTLQAFLQMYENQVNELAGGVGDTSILDSAWSDAEKHPLIPSTLYFIAGRQNVFYGRQMLVGRQRQTSVDVGIVSRSINSKPGFSLYATPQAVFNSDDISNTSLQIEVADPAYPTKRFRRSVSAVVTPATGTGTLPITVLGDSKSASYWASLYPNIVSAGITVQDLGTRTVSVSAVDRNYEGRAGWSTRDYIGKSYAPNPFLKTADAGDLAAKPDLCFGDTGSTVRESYTENSGLASYSIFSWETWATAQSLSTSAKFVAILQLGHNDQTNGADWLDDVELGHNHIVDDFLATFPNGAIVVVQEGIKSGIDVSGDNGQTQWNTVQMPLAKLKMELFSGRESEGVYLVHSFLQENMDFNSLYTTDSTDSVTGVQKNTLSDIIHPTGQTSREWVNAVLPVVLYLQANL